MIVQQRGLTTLIGLLIVTLATGGAWQLAGSLGPEEADAAGFLRKSAVLDARTMKRVSSRFQLSKWTVMPSRAPATRSYRLCHEGSIQWGRKVWSQYGVPTTSLWKRHLRTRRTSTEGCSLSGSEKLSLMGSYR